MKKTINGEDWKKAMVSGINAISNNKEIINSLNVFPVPDGDTGSNMAATGEYAVNEIKNLNSHSISAVASKFSKGMLLGARGNSGVILSQIFKGMSVGFGDKEEVGVNEVIGAFRVAKEYAYKAVMKPVEGTILTVIRIVADQLSKNETKYKSVTEVFEASLKFAREACDKTPSLLPILKEVGVNDSGGEGLFNIFEGIYKSLIGKPVQIEEETNKTKSMILIQDEIYDGEFGYCTEFILTLKNYKTFDKKKFEKLIEKCGSSIVIVRDDELLKVHIHTLKPGEVFNLAQRYGEFLKIKSENMEVLSKEAQEAKKQAIALKHPVHLDKNVKMNIGVISCNSGPGIIQYMKDLGVSYIIEGGQTMNPSAKDFITAIDSLPAEKIMLLPNNPNIILVARQVAQTSKKQVIVVPSRSQPEGIAALMFFDQDVPLRQNKKNMDDAIKSVQTGSVTVATKSTKIDGVKVYENEYLAIAGKKILKSNKSKIRAALIVANHLMDKNTEIATIYYGEKTTEDEAKELASLITKVNHNVEVEVKDGGQPIYHFMLAFE